MCVQQESMYYLHKIHKTYERYERKYKDIANAMVRDMTFQMVPECLFLLAALSASPS